MAILTITGKNKSNVSNIDNKIRESFYRSVSDLVLKANAFAIESGKSRINNASIQERSDVPEYHRTVADEFMIIIRIFGHPVVQCKLADEEREFLAKYDFNPIEFSTSKQIEEELTLLRKWSRSRDAEIQKAGDRLISLRSKELKNLIATNYVGITNEVYKGYKILEKYFESISKYRQV